MTVLEEAKVKFRFQNLFYAAYGPGSMQASILQLSKKEVLA